MIKIANKDELPLMINKRSGLLNSKYEKDIKDAINSDKCFKDSLIIIIDKNLNIERTIPSLIIPKLSCIFSFIENNEFLQHIIIDDDKNKPIYLCLETIKEFPSELSILINNTDEQTIARLNIPYFLLTDVVDINKLLNELKFSLVDFNQLDYKFYRNTLNEKRNRDAFIKLNNKVRYCNAILQSHYNLKYRDFKSIEDLSNLFHGPFDVDEKSPNRLNYDSNFLDAFLFIVNKEKIFNYTTYEEAVNFLKNFSFIRRMLKKHNKYNYIIECDYFKSLSLSLSLTRLIRHENNPVIFIKITAQTDVKNLSSIFLNSVCRENGEKETALTLKHFIVNEEETLKHVSLLTY